MFEKEYDTLRNELNDNRKYVFERPLIIFTAACIFFDYISKTDYIMLFPCLIVLLLLFNLDFTVNRLNSNARIIAYIRLFIEKNDPANYQWESFLHAYRLKGEDKGLKYYPIIYFFHVILIIFFYGLQILLYFDNHRLEQIPTNIKIITVIISIFLIIGSLIYLFSMWKRIFPNRIKAFFDEETKNVEEIIELMKKQK